MSCSTMRIVRSRAMRRIRSTVACVSVTLIPAVGSSRHKRFGSVASAIPISRLRCSPCERFDASSSSLPVSPTSARTARARAMTSPYDRWWRSMLQLWRRDWLAIRTFSSTVAPGRMLVIWYERAIALRETRCGGRPAMFSPLNRIRPLVGRRTPVRQLKRVDLPAPLGPMIPRISPAGTASDTLLSAASPPKRIVSASVLRIGGALVSVATRARLQRSAPGSPGRSEHPRLRGAARQPPVSSRELARRRDERLFLGDRFQELVLVVLDGEDELPDEGLMVFFPDRLVALREVVALLDVHPLQGLDQVHRVLAAPEAGFRHPELQEVHRLEVRLHVAVRQRAGRIDLLELDDGLIEELLVVWRVQRRVHHRNVAVDAHEPFDLLTERRQVRGLGDGAVAGILVLLGEAEVVDGAREANGVRA